MGNGASEEFHGDIRLLNFDKVKAAVEKTPKLMKSTDDDYNNYKPLHTAVIRAWTIESASPSQPAQKQRKEKEDALIYEIMTFIIEHPGCEKDAPDKHGRTALEIATHFFSVRLVRFLLQHKNHLRTSFTEFG